MKVKNYAIPAGFSHRFFTVRREPLNYHKVIKELNIPPA